MKHWVLSTLLLTASPAFAAKAVVIVPVADLRLDQSLPEPGKSDDKQLTQLLFGETVEVVKSSGDWVYVNAIEQPSFKYHQRWEGYPGWVRKYALKLEPLIKDPKAVVLSTWTSLSEPENAPDLWIPLGSFVHPVGQTDQWYVVPTLGGDRCLVKDHTLPLNFSSWNTRGMVLQVAKSMLGVTYMWGGLTAGSDPTHPLASVPLNSGVDCSGLVHLSYRVNSIMIPRDSHEQWMKAEPIKRNQLMPADLIFSAHADKPKKITHVALYAGGDQIIEAPQTGMLVRKVSFKEKYGAEMSSVESGTKVGDRVIFFGKFLKD